MTFTKWYPDEQYSMPSIDGNVDDPLISVKERTIATYKTNSLIYSGG